MLRSKIVKSLIKEAKGAVKLQLTVKDGSIAVTKETSGTPTRFKVLTTLASIIYALPRSFLKGVKVFLITAEPTSFTVYGENDKYAVAITSIPKGVKVEADDLTIPDEFAYFCKLYGLAKGNNEVFKINFQLK